MKLVCELNKCNGCMACVEKCPKKCIHIKDTIEAYNAVIDEDDCINCKICEKCCPNITKVSKIKPQKWYQGWATDETRKNSTSGGVASAIITNFIENGGYVASCLYKDGKFGFSITNNLYEAKGYAGSKYVKSTPEGIYNKIEKKLKNNKVLFIGLPCQVAALKNIIKDQTNLYTIDLICHGTPSPKLLEKYLIEEGIELSSIDNIKFRNKTDYGLIINGKKVTLPKVMDDYVCAFLESVNFTENCYSCNYATLDRVSDITLGDSWGTELKDEGKKGVSLILIQNEKGKELIKSTNLTLNDVDLEKAIINNPQLSYPSKKKHKREEFLKLISKGKSFKYSTFVVLPKKVIKQKIKYILFKLIKNQIL